jgi:hypothetical protein
LPIRLTVIFLILALTVPVIVGMAENLEKDAERSDLSVQAKIISDTARKTYYAGVGGMFTADISVNHNCRLDIGGESSDSYAIKMFRADEDVGMIVMDRPPVRIVEPLSLTGNLTLKFECVSYNEKTAVKVSVI